MKVARLALMVLLCAKMVYTAKYWIEMERREDIQATYVIYNLTSDIIKDTDERINRLEYVRLNNFRSASFEIGFLGYLIVEEYRKMVDKYNTSISSGGYLYPMETVLYLYEIETHYWQIKHLVNMQHEIERKYRIISDLKGKPEDMLETAATEDPAHKTRMRKTKDKETKWLEQAEAILAGTTKKKSTRWWWPIEYGWEIETLW